MYTKISRVVHATAPVALAALMGCLSQALGAQGTGPARIEGVVTDSLHGRPATGATVTAMRVGDTTLTFRSAIVDERGRFRLDSLVAGRYMVSFISPLLDSLALVLPERPVEVAAGARAELALGIPSSATLRGAACPGVVLEPGRGAIVGTVIDAATEHAMPGATVVIAWVDIAVDPSSARVATTPRTAAVTADSAGLYRLCGVPTDSRLELQVQHAAASGGIIETMVRDSIGLLRQDLSFSPLDPALATTSADTTPSPATSAAALPPAGRATVAGTVVGADDRPLPDVELRVAGSRGTARSDAAGRFTLAGQPAGTQMLEARRIGYDVARVAVELRPDRVTTQSLKLSHVVTLDSVRIVAQRSKYREFEQHRTNAFGRFLTEADLLKRNPFNTSDLFRTMSGFRVVRNGFGDVLVSARGASSFRSGVCRTNVVIDGMPGGDIDLVHPADIGAIEIYNGPAGAPPQYDSRCGLVIIWTRR